MKQLKVALFVKPTKSTFERENRNMGYWSYAVPEFTWDHFAFNNQRVCLAQYNKYDLIFHEDSGFCTYDDIGDCPPTVYLSIDSTLSDDHYQKRLTQAKQADLVVVDHDRLEKFKVSGRPVRRLNYCVNDKVFKPDMFKSTDISFHCGGGARKGMPGGVERNEIRAELDQICKANGWSFSSGALGLNEYAANMAASKIVVNWPRTVINRPHRIFDTMACKTALATGAFPLVDGDLLEAGHDYSLYNRDNLADALGYLMSGNWESVAESGYRLVMSNHTWAIRAQQLRQMVYEVFGI